MNETQKAFMSVLQDGQIKSLKQVSAALGMEIKSGSIVALIGKSIVKSLPDAVEYSVKVVEVRTYADGTEITIEKVKKQLEDKNTKGVEVCVMLDKPSRRKVDLDPDFVGFSIDDVFIVGYGLNYGDHYRNIPYIFTFDDQPTD